MFTHLHLHTQFSLLDGACRLGNLVTRAKELGMTSLAITDHGNMYGAVDFYKECKKQGIKPIIGCEVYVAPRTRFDRDKVLDKEYNHLVLLVKNETGYKNLIKMVSLSHTEGFYFKPRIDRDLIEKHSDGLVCLSACMVGEVATRLLERDYDAAKRAAEWYDDVFGRGNYFLEMQNHGIQEQKIINDGIKRLSRETGIPLVATNDVHYVEKDDAQIQQVLICISTNHVLGEDTGLEFHSDNFYLKSEKEMRELFFDTPQAVDNTALIADMCNFDFEFGKTKLPYFETPGNIDHFQYFKSLCYSGLKKRYGDDVPTEYIKRLEYELGIIENMGFTDYFLIVQDFVGYAKSKKIPVGPGRGSGAGSIAAYCIGITDLDPMKYDLIFERFLNPERVSMPDFDIDFCYERRQEVIDYVTEKYGSDYVAHIVTFGTLKARSAIRDVGRVLGMPYASVDAVAKLISSDPRITLDGAIESRPQLKKLIQESPEIARLVDIAKRVEGFPRNTSTHAAGVVITHDPVSSYVPLAKNDDMIATQYIMTTLEELGLLKIDFLGNRNITIIDDAARAVGVDIDSIPIDDEAVYKMFAKGHTDGIFQFESTGMRSTLTRMKPKRFEDLVAAIALYRPGPASQIDTYIANSKNPFLIKYETPLLKDILDTTYGCMIYQEQVMQIFRSLAGYSYGRADSVRRAMSKKKHSEMEKERDNFISGCEKNGISKEISNGLFDRMLDFASYAFNKSHAACYALVSYRCAYMKHYYPAEFMAALLTSVLDSPDKVAQYMAECKRMGIRLAPPDINTSMKGFTANGNIINYGLLGVKNLGRDFIDDIIAERKKAEFVDLFDFCNRMSKGFFNRRAVESLVRCGALDNLGANRRQMLQGLPVLINSLEEQNRKTKYGQVGFFDISDDFASSFEFPDVEEFPKSELLNMEKEMTGLYLSGHPMDKMESYINKSGCVRSFEIASGSVKDGSNVKVCGIISRITVKQTRASKANMAFVTLEDIYGTIEIILFPKVFEKFSRYIVQGNIIAVSGTLSFEDDEARILVNTVIDPENDAPKSQNETAPKKNKRQGLFIKFENRESELIPEIENLLSIFDGSFPLYFFYEDTHKYELQPREHFVDINPTLIAELKRRLSDKNVALIY